MKKIFTIVIIALIVACSKSDNKTGNVELSGNIEGLKQGKLFIQQLKDTNLVIIDSIMISGESNFETKFQIEEPQMLYLSLDRGTTKSIDNSIHFFAEPRKMKIETTLDGFYVNQKIYEKYLKIKSNLNDENLDLLEKEIKNNISKNASITEEINNKRDKLTIRKYLYTANFALVNPKFEVSPYITLTEIPDASLKILDTINKTLDPKIAKSKYGKRLNEWIKERKTSEEN